MDCDSLRDDQWERITNEAVDELHLAVGGTAYAVVKAFSVMVAVEDCTNGISAKKSPA
ncbi:hypothetical protein ACFSE0_12900 [Ochrobactrum teleogrylli]|uniref:hypothetical protein n=1 Tax=Ochrobactrum teleogrylli TaxID=2479765 RepID=UPI0015DE20C0|nr:hypothetical protein [[Ochrobactrum] teleogrylli]